VADQFDTRLRSIGGADAERRLIRWQQWHERIGDVAVIPGEIEQVALPPAIGLTPGLAGRAQRLDGDSGRLERLPDRWADGGPWLPQLFWNGCTLCQCGSVRRRITKPAGSCIACVLSRHLVAQEEAGPNIVGADVSDFADNFVDDWFLARAAGRHAWKSTGLRFQVNGQVAMAKFHRRRWREAGAVGEGAAACVGDESFDPMFDPNFDPTR
jgi:hypothetical protein